jgi:diguanylate cyclase (GGDEF)-like protein
VLNFAQTILEAARTVTVQNQRSLTVSIGIAHRSSDQSFENVMKRADQALYRAKKTGRDRLEVA